MAVKFPLEMKDGVQVRNISELKENFDIEKVVGYFLDGKLKKWLDARWYEDESEEISKLDGSDPLLAQHLCEIFGVEYEAEKINLEEIAARNVRISKLKQYTDDEIVLKNIDIVAFNQKEMMDLLNKKINEIYLCGEKFEISLFQRDVRYIGVNSPVVMIPIQEEVDFKELGIQFEGIEFDEQYKEIMLPKYDKAVELHGEKQYEQAKALFEQYAEKGNADAMWYLGLYYKYGYGTKIDSQKSYAWYLKGAETGDSDSMNSVAICYEEGKGVKEDRKKAAEWYKKGAEAGQMYAMYNWARCCEDGIGVWSNSDRSSEAYLYWYEKSAELGHSGSMGRLASYYRHKDYNKAIYWAQKGEENNNEKSVEVLVNIYNRSGEYDKVFSVLEPRAKNGDIRAMITLYHWYSTDRVVLKPYRNYKKAFHWLKMAAEAGDLNSINELGNIYNSGNWGVTENIAEARRWWAKANSATGMWSWYDL